MKRGPGARVVLHAPAGREKRRFSKCITSASRWSLSANHPELKRRQAAVVQKSAHGGAARHNPSPAIYQRFVSDVTRWPALQSFVPSV